MSSDTLADPLMSRYLSELDRLTGPVIESYAVEDAEHGISIMVNGRSALALSIRRYGETVWVSQSVQGGSIKHTWHENELVNEEIDFVSGILACLKQNVEYTGEPTNLEYFHDHIFRGRVVRSPEQVVRVYEFYAYHQDDAPVVSFFNVDDSLIFLDIRMFGWEGVPEEVPFARLPDSG